jgi:hypothetical protein
VHKYDQREDLRATVGWHAGHSYRQIFIHRTRNTPCLTSSPSSRDLIIYICRSNCGSLEGAERCHDTNECQSWGFHPSDLERRSPWPAPERVIEEASGHPKSSPRAQRPSRQRRYQRQSGGSVGYGGRLLGDEIGARVAREDAQRRSCER